MVLMLMLVLVSGGDGGVDGVGVLTVLSSSYLWPTFEGSADWKNRHSRWACLRDPC
jgi:hypothetical protein